MHPNLTLIAAAQYGNLANVAEALRLGADANAVIERWTPLLWAAQEGHVKVVELLLDAGANVNYADWNGFTPLFQASGESHIETAECLLLRGANVNHRCHSASGCTVLHIAAAYGRLDCVRLLLRYGASLQVRNNDGRTPYDTAVECGESDAADLLQLHPAM